MGYTEERSILSCDFFNPDYKFTDKSLLNALANNTIKCKM